LTRGFSVSAHKAIIIHRAEYLHGLLDRLPRDDTGGLDTDTSSGLVVKRSGTVDGVAESVDDTAEKFDTDGDVDDGSSSLDNISFLDQLVVTFILK
jgi:hypothetical protein